MSYISKNSDEGLMRYGNPDAPFLDKINFFSQISYNKPKLKDKIIVLSVPERSEGTEVLKIHIHSAE